MKRPDDIKTSITLWSTNDELARWVQVQIGVLAIQSQSWLKVFEFDFCDCGPMTNYSKALFLSFMDGAVISRPV